MVGQITLFKRLTGCKIFEYKWRKLMKLFVKPVLLLALLFSFSASVMAQPELYVEGTHYTALAEPVRTADLNTIEVTEIFWYGCAHCYAFEPLITSWESSLPADVAFVRSPGMWNGLMETHAQIYYTAEALGVFDQTHSAAFDEIHQRGNYLQTEEQVRAFFVTKDVDPADFDKTWNSFSVTSAVKKANTRMSEYGIRGVPNMVVNGKYRVSVGEGIATQADMLKVVDFLVEKERSS
jgi:protein dithiol oxidoreductase (disulfide-forming)